MWTYLSKSEAKGQACESQVGGGMKEQRPESYQISANSFNVSSCEFATHRENGFKPFPSLSETNRACSCKDGPLLCNLSTLGQLDIETNKYI